MSMNEPLSAAHRQIVKLMSATGRTYIAKDTPMWRLMEELIARKLVFRGPRQRGLLWTFGLTAAGKEVAEEELQQAPDLSLPQQKRHQ